MKKIKIFAYNAIFEKEADGGYAVWVPSLPGCCSQGDNFERALKNIKEAIELYIEDSDREVLAEGRKKKSQFLVPVEVGIHQYA